MKTSMKQAVISIASASFLLAVTAPVWAQDSVCPDCELLEARAQALAATPLKIQDQIQMPVQDVLAHLGAPLSFDFASWMAPPALVVNWGIGQPLPYSFQIPWELPKTDFSPAFVTPFYNDSGIIPNSPEAPWNLFRAQPLAPAAPATQEVPLRLT
jgi:hypothetical protein